MRVAWIDSTMFDHAEIRVVNAWVSAERETDCENGRIGM